MSKRRWEQVGAAGRIVFILLQLVDQGLIQAGGSEPAFTKRSAASAVAAAGPQLLTVDCFPFSVFC
jgi:hypothetical protein